MDVVVQGEYINDANCLECSEAITEITIPHRNDTADIDDALLPSEYDPTAMTDNVVFKRRHSVGVHIECKAKSDGAPSGRHYALVNVKYKYNEMEPTTLNTNIEYGKWFSQRVKVFVNSVE
jgi:hypothetical protein